MCFKYFHHAPLGNQFVLKALACLNKVLPTYISFLLFGIGNATFANRLHHQSSENFLHIGGIDHASTLPLSLTH
jgi:hypothetical protein